MHARYAASFGVAFPPEAVTHAIDGELDYSRINEARTLCGRHFPFAVNHNLNSDVEITCIRCVSKAAKNPPLAAVTYHGRITTKAAHPSGLTSRQSGWTCDHAHRSVSLAFDCAVAYARSGALRRSRGQRTEAASAGICHLVIEAVPATAVRA